MCVRRTTPPCNSGKVGISEDPNIIPIIPYSYYYWVGVLLKYAFGWSKISSPCLLHFGRRAWDWGMMLCSFQLNQTCLPIFHNNLSTLDYGAGFKLRSSGWLPGLQASLFLHKENCIKCRCLGTAPHPVTVDVRGH